MIRNILRFLLTFCFVLSSGYFNCSMGSTIACSGQASSSVIMGDNIISHTSYVLRNFNDNKTINIIGIKVYDAGGSVLCDFPNKKPFPATFSSSLSPHASTKINTLDMVSAGCLSVQSEGTLQTIITWSGKGESLNVLATPINLNTTDGETLFFGPILCTPVNPR